VISNREHLGWVLHEAGPADAEHAVLLLPGALASWAFYEDLLAEPSIRESGMRFIATTIPGFGGTSPLADLSMESYSRLAARLAADLSCDVVVGHSLGANLAVEMVSAGEFSGLVVLLSPSFSRKDESIVPRALDRLSRVFGHLPYTLVLKMIGPAFGSSLPSARRDLLVNELKNNNPRFVRSQTRSYLAYLDRHGSLAKRFCETGVRAWVVFGEKDDIGLAPAERELLTAASNVTLVEIADTGHFGLNNKPDQIAAIVLQAVKNARSERS
jgi:pimeloyl-ACP methyl ester carboxylesterase